jgi:hypothetical protein
MTQTRPRDLTDAELELLKAPAQRARESAPLTVPPGTQLPVHLVNPVGNQTTSDNTRPTASPPGGDG